MKGTTTPKILCRTEAVSRRRRSRFDLVFDDARARANYWIELIGF
jgi:hypothetical protein